MDDFLEKIDFKKIENGTKSTFNSFLGIVVIPYIVEFIIEKDSYDECEAINVFYHSEVYKRLESKESNLWRLSRIEIYQLWKSEYATGRIIPK